MLFFLFFILPGHSWVFVHSAFIRHKAQQENIRGWQQREQRCVSMLHYGNAPRSYLCFSCLKPLVSNLCHLMCRCAWVWNMLSFHGKDRTLFLPTGRRNVFFQFFFFGKICHNFPKSHKAPTKQIEISSVALGNGCLFVHHDIIISWAIVSVTIQTIADVMTLR